MVESHGEHCWKPAVWRCEHSSPIGTWVWFGLAVPSAAPPTDEGVMNKFDLAKVSVTVTFQVMRFLACYGACVSPSGRFPSDVIRSLPAAWLLARWHVQTMCVKSYWNKNERRFAEQSTERFQRFTKQFVERFHRFAEQSAERFHRFAERCLTWFHFDSNVRASLRK